MLFFSLIFSFLLIKTQCLSPTIGICLHQDFISTTRNVDLAEFLNLKEVLRKIDLGQEAISEWETKLIVLDWQWVTLISWCQKSVTLIAISRIILPLQSDDQVKLETFNSDFSNYFFVSCIKLSKMYSPSVFLKYRLMLYVFESLKWKAKI